MKHLTNREEEIMELFWEKGSLYVKEIIELLAGPKPHYNTISTIVRGLEEKGFVDHEQFGNTHRYFAKISLTLRWCPCLLKNRKLQPKKSRS